MADFATLVLAADSRGLVSGEQALNSLATTAERTEQRTNKANGAMSKGMGDAAKATEQLGRSAASQQFLLRNLAYQVNQIGQQGAVTGNYLQALTIQLPDIFASFGGLPMVLAGGALAVTASLVPALLSGQNEAKSLAERMDDLGRATDEYRSAVENTLLPVGDLIEKFGGQAEGAERVYEAMRKIKELEFHEAMTAARDAISGSLEEIASSIERYDFASANFMHPDAVSAVRTEVALLENQFGLTLIQATRIRDALEDFATADGPGEVAQAAMRLGDELARAADEGAELSPKLREVQKDAYEASLNAAEFARLTGAAIGPANGLAAAVSGVADQYARAAQYAAYLTSKYPSQGAYSGVERSADGPIQGESFPLPENGPTPGSRPLIELDGLPGQFSARGGGRRRGGGGGGKGLAESYDEIVKSAERRIASLEAERNAIGLTDQAADKLRNTTDLLNDAQQKGIKLTDPQKEKLESLADTMARVEAETRAAQEQMDFFEDISNEMKDGILDVIFEGEKASDVFKGLAKSIARAALEAALFGSGPLAGGGGNGGGGILGSIFGFLPKLLSFDGGGYTGSGSRSGGLDGKGGYVALVHPEETIIDHTKGGAGGVAVDVNVRAYVDDTGNWQAEVERVSQKQVQQAAPAIVSAANQQVVPTMARYQRDKVGGDYRNG